MFARTVRCLVTVMLCLQASALRATPGELFGQPLSDFARRREAVRQAAHDALVLIQGPVEREDIDRVRFRTDNNLLYLTGIEASGAWLALLPAGDPSGKREILFLPAPWPGAEQWADPVPVPGTVTERATGIESVQNAADMWATLRPSLLKAREVLLQGPVGTDTANERIERKIRALISGKSVPAGEGGVRPTTTGPSPATIGGGAERLIHPLRWIKSAGEAANLRAAIAATGDAERAAGRTIRPGVTEMAVEGVILAAFRHGGAPREGFPCIVGAGPYSCVLHHPAGLRPIGADETVVVDIGAEFNYYSADITRTFPSSGRFTARQRQIYQLVLDTQRACERQVVPGKTTLRELNEFASDFLRRSPLRARDRTGAEKTMDEFFIHGLGHWLGMDVHDVSGGSNVLQPGVVFTIEPGLYIASEGIGVRIEDDYLVTATGLEKLSRQIPSSIADIEALMRTSVGARERGEARAESGPR